jgi:mannan endo-1,4-beta-mannosidase
MSGFSFARGKSSRGVWTGSVTRPSYNTGVGFFVGTNLKLYDANGIEFRIKGINRTHYDSGSDSPIYSGSYANSQRMIAYLNGTRAVSAGYGTGDAGNVAQFQEWISHSIVPIPGIWSPSAGGSVTGSTNPTDLTHAVDDWVATVSNYQPLERWMILNIANEWGPADFSVYRDSYITAVSRLRTAGYKCTLMIDASVVGQSWYSIVDSAAAIFNSDSQKNVIFSWHSYGSSYESTISVICNYLTRAGVPVIIGEFGPPTPPNVMDPSPTDALVATRINSADSNALGWLAWAWDDNDLGGGTSDDAGFAMVYNNVTLSLNNFGSEVVQNSSYGLQYHATKATVFP